MIIHPLLCLTSLICLADYCNCVYVPGREGWRNSSSAKGCYSCFIWDNPQKRSCCGPEDQTEGVHLLMVLTPVFCVVPEINVSLVELLLPVLQLYLLLSLMLIDYLSINSCSHDIHLSNSSCHLFYSSCNL